MGSKVSLLLALAFAALYLHAEYMLNTCEKVRAQQAAAFNKAMNIANQRAYEAVQRTRSQYEAALRELQVSKLSLDKEYAAAVSAIYNTESSDEEYKAWASKRIPTTVIRRLRQLPETRPAD